MNNTSKALIACLIAVGVWIGFQQMRPAKVTSAETTCAPSG